MECFAAASATCAHADRYSSVCDYRYAMAETGKITEHCGVGFIDCRQLCCLGFCGMGGSRSNCTLSAAEVAPRGKGFWVSIRELFSMLKYMAMKKGFWGQFERGFTCLAPMEGVTDSVFRRVVARAARPDIFFTEFTNVSSYASDKGRANAVQRLRFLPEEMPIVAQIWGINPEHFAATAGGVRDMDYPAVDINMG